MDDQSVTRSIPGSVGLLGTLTIAGLAVLGLWGVVDGYLLQTGGEYFLPTLGVLAVVVLVVGTLIALGVRSKRWLEGPYW
ncbi:hypothetical protein GS429_09535 [Natronorubrum sp. JWXQ-INN-674]|uniref:Uncharacterized protein n=1 Tax=Natronorubrum halalkaliphilum TaxID=2691917 RepID=A0A6B0VMH7_9EURY|nr:hypothetical protein [Natronorubrum halalkaliphilum]MXV62297.1 hypothetical protein [Natronorubrum halalkaliphilum]